MKKFFRTATGFALLLPAVLARGDEKGIDMTALMIGDVNSIARTIEANPKSVNVSVVGPPIAFAAQSGKENVVELLLAHGADVNARGVWGCTALHFAAQRGDLKMVDFLLDHHADVNARDDIGLTPIVVAQSNLDVVKLLVAHGASVSSNGGDNTLLSQILNAHECDRGVAEIEFLIANNVDVEANQTEGLFQMVLFNASPRYLALLTPYYLRSPKPTVHVLWEGALCAAMNNGRFDSASAMIEDSLRLETQPIYLAVMSGANDAVKAVLAPNQNAAQQTGVLGFTPLHVAALTNQYESAETLLAKGADINAKDELGNTPLIWAAYFGYEKVVDVLLKGHPGLDIPSNQVNTTLGVAGNTALDFAILRGFTPIALKLIANGASVGTAKWYGQTPLHLAASTGNAQVIAALLAHGADVDAHTNGKVSPIELAVAGNSAESVQELVKGGAKITEPISDGGTLFTAWAVKGDVTVAEALKAAGLDPSAMALNGKTPLGVAVCSRQTPAVEWLLKHGVDVNTADKDGLTALHLAVIQGGNALVRTLIDHGADVNAKDKKGQTPIERLDDFEWSRGGRSESLDFPDVLQLLRAHGAKDPRRPPPVPDIIE